MAEFEQPEKTTEDYYVKIGNKVWMDKEARPYLYIYCWFVNRVTKDVVQDSRVMGQVLYGHPIKMSRIAKELGVSWKTVQRGVDRLVELGYLSRQILAEYTDKNTYKVKELKEGEQPKQPYQYWVVDSIKNGLKAPEPCGICGEHVQNLEQHQKACERNHKYCHECEKWFPHADYPSHECDEYVECAQCGNGDMYRKSEMESHLFSYHDLDVCGYCDNQQYMTREERKQHLSTCLTYQEWYRTKNGVVREQQKPRTIGKCDFCGETFSNYEKMNAHVKNDCTAPGNPFRKKAVVA